MKRNISTANLPFGNNEPCPKKISNTNSMAKSVDLFYNMRQ